MTIQGIGTDDKQRALLSPQTKLGEVVKKFGGKASGQQAALYDEYDFRFHEDDLREEIYKFSHGCNLNLLLAPRSRLDLIKSKLSGTSG